MPLKLSIRLILLITSLIATIFAITWLKKGHMEAFWTSLGFENTARLNWCEERVGQLYLFETSGKLYEEKNRWLWQQKGEDRVLDYLRVEKWFAKYCQVDFSKETDPAGTENFRPIFEAQFIDGQRLTLYRSESGLFKARDRVFASETLRQALKELLAFAPKMK